MTMKKHETTCLPYLKLAPSYHVHVLFIYVLVIPFHYMLYFYLFIDCLPLWDFKSHKIKFSVSFAYYYSLNPGIVPGS